MKPRSDRSREALLKLMATPVRRKYFETLRRMLGPAGLISIREEQFFLVLAIAIGILAGFCVVLFRVAIAAARLWLLGSSMHPSAPRVVLVPAVMGLVIAVLAVRFFPRVRGSGVNQTKGALYIYDGYISPEDRGGKVCSERAGHRQRTIAGAGRPGAADRRGPGFGAGAMAEALQGTDAAGGAGGRGGRHWRRPSMLRSRQCCS